MIHMISGRVDCNFLIIYCCLIIIYSISYLIPIHYRNYLLYFIIIFLYNLINAEMIRLFKSVSAVILAFVMAFLFIIFYPVIVIYRSLI